MEITDLVEKYPRLFHMSTADSWGSIRQHGLWTTNQIAETSGLSPAEIDSIKHRHRARSISFDHPVLGPVTIRDTAALRLVFAEPILIDVTVEQYLQVLNSRVFFWLHEKRLAKLLDATRYRGLEQDVIVVDTESLVDAYLDRIELSPYNSGATTQKNAPPRGRETFQPIASYPFDERRRSRALQDSLVELCVLDGVPDLARHAVAIQRWRGAELLGEQLL